MLKARVEDYIAKALQAGTMPKDDIIIVAMIAQLLDKDPMDVQSSYMDCSIAFQIAFRKLQSGEAAQEAINKNRRIEGGGE